MEKFDGHSLNVPENIKQYGVMLSDNTWIKGYQYQGKKTIERARVHF
jgi:hypothetical protein